MLSIDNTYSVEELREYGERVAKLLPDETIEWVVELKIDGVAVALMYEKGRLNCAATRGNGVVGDDITHNIRTVLGVPLKCTASKVPALLEVRGEVYMTNADLVRLNTAQAKGTSCSPTAATSRPAPCECSIRGFAPSAGCGFFATGSGESKAFKATTHMEFLKEIRGYGLPATPMVECFSTVRGGRRALRRTDRATARAGVRDRRPGVEGESFRPAPAAGQHLEKPALGDRLQIREIRRHDQGQ